MVLEGAGDDAARSGNKSPVAPATASTGQFPYAELARSSRSKCIHCGAKIEKDTLRIAVERQFEAPGGTMTGVGYLDPACAKAREDVTLTGVLQNSPDLAPAQRRQWEEIW